MLGTRRTAAASSQTSNSATTARSTVSTRSSARFQTTGVSTIGAAKENAAPAGRETRAMQLRAAANKATASTTATKTETAPATKGSSLTQGTAASRARTAGLTARTNTQAAGSSLAASSRVPASSRVTRATAGSASTVGSSKTATTSTTTTTTTTTRRGASTLNSSRDLGASNVSAGSAVDLSITPQFDDTPSNSSFQHNSSNSSFDQDFGVSARFSFGSPDASHLDAPDAQEILAAAVAASSAGATLESDDSLPMNFDLPSTPAARKPVSRKSSASRSNRRVTRSMSKEPQVDLPDDAQLALVASVDLSDESSPETQPGATPAPSEKSARRKATPARSARKSRKWEDLSDEQENGSAEDEAAAQQNDEPPASQDEAGDAEDVQADFHTSFFSSLNFSYLGSPAKAAEAQAETEAEPELEEASEEEPKAQTPKKKPATPKGSTGKKGRGRKSLASADEAPQTPASTHQGQIARTMASPKSPDLSKLVEVALRKAEGEDVNVDESNLQLKHFFKHDDTQALSPYTDLSKRIAAAREKIETVTARLETEPEGQPMGEISRRLSLGTLKDTVEVDDIDLETPAPKPRASIFDAARELFSRGSTAVGPHSATPAKPNPKKRRSLIFAEGSSSSANTVKTVIILVFTYMFLSWLSNLLGLDYKKKK